MNQIGSSFYSLEQLAGEYLQKKQVDTGSVSNNGQSFEEILSAKADNQVSFSKHANERLNSRNIELDESQLNRLNQGVEQARQKNIKESLVMMDNLAFIVNVNNNTVITALDQSGDSSNVFTNIDGAVII